LALCVVALARHRAAWILGWLTAGLAIAATAFSRVELGVHWITDVIAGVVFVAGWLTAVAISLGGRLRRPEPVLDRAGAPQPLPRQGESRVNLRLSGDGHHTIRSRRNWVLEAVNPYLTPQLDNLPALASDASADDRGGNMACRSSGLAQGGQAAPRCRGTRTHRFTVVRLIF